MRWPNLITTGSEEDNGVRATQMFVPDLRCTCHDYNSVFYSRDNLAIEELHNNSCKEELTQNKVPAETLVEKSLVTSAGGVW